MSAQVLDPLVAGDPVLIARVRAGDAEAYAELFDRHRPAALAFARRLAGANHAEDLVAEAFVKVLDALRRDLGPTVSFRSYLLTAVRSLWANTVRSEVRYDLVPDYEASPTISEALSFSDDPDARFDNQAVATAFRSLPERWQAVLWYSAVEGLPHAEIATLLGIKANAVAALNFRAREGLREAYLSQHLNGTGDAVCQAMLPLLPAYARGHLDKRKVPALESHLENCADCAAALADLDEVNNRLGALLLPIVLGLAAARSGWPFELGDGGGGGAGIADAGAAPTAGTASTVGSTATRIGAAPITAKSALLVVLAAVGVTAPLAGDMPARPHREVAVATDAPVRSTDQSPRAVPTPRRSPSPRPARPAPPVAPVPPAAPLEPRSTQAPPHEAAPMADHPPHVAGITPGNAGGQPTHPPTTATNPPVTPAAGDIGVGTISISRIGFAGQNAAELTIPVTNATPGARAVVVVTNLVGLPITPAKGWRCAGALGSVPTDGIIPTTTTIECTFTGSSTSSTPLKLTVLTSGPATATAKVTPAAGLSDPNPANNTATVVIEP